MSGGKSDRRTTMNPLPITVHASAESLAIAVACRLADAIRDGVAARGEAWLALAGGSTPFAAYRKLAAMDLPWHRVNLVASDERVVPATHEKRNERALAEAFAGARGVTIHPLVASDGATRGATGACNDATPGDPALATAQASLGALAHRAFDAVLLGMGADAHFASLFPQVTPASALDAGHRAPFVALTPDPLPPEAPFPRVSLTLSRLIATHSLMLMITGEAKRAALEAARTRSASEAPIHALLAAAPDLAIHWSP
ncbi:MAG TPA: 6-phosphogluconolactonase [Xanthomonadaceae bacterium]|nr:6-phosphogluconolactonase [Xanthomonadaceae bacterium]